MILKKIFGLFAAVLMVVAVAAVRPAHAITYSTDPATGSSTNSSATNGSSTNMSGSTNNTSNSTSTNGSTSGTAATPSGGVAAGTGGADTTSAMAWTFLLLAIGAAGLIATRKNKLS